MQDRFQLLGFALGFLGLAIIGVALAKLIEPPTIILEETRDVLLLEHSPQLGSIPKIIEKCIEVASLRYSRLPSGSSAFDTKIIDNAKKVLGVDHQESRLFLSFGSRELMNDFDFELFNRAIVGLYVNCIDEDVKRIQGLTVNIPEHAMERIGTQLSVLENETQAVIKDGKIFEVIFTKGHTFKGEKIREPLTGSSVVLGLILIGLGFLIRGKGFKSLSDLMSIFR